MFLSITPRNILSFGPETEPIELRPLNLLIGPNASGKSNLLETIALMRATASDPRAVIRSGGGVGEWLWKGDSEGAASVDLVVKNPKGCQPLRHVLEFNPLGHEFHIMDERIENDHPYPGRPDPYFYYRYQNGDPVFNLGGEQRRPTRERLEHDLSILSQRRDPEQYPEMSHLANTYEKARIYREWTFGRDTLFRRPQPADMRSDRLEEDFSNLGLFLNRLRRFPDAKDKILDCLRDLYSDFTDFDVLVEGGTVQVFFTEGRFVIPATRLSDGTLRYLCLLAILCDPTPPPLVCIEEPELGLHPDLLPKIAGLLSETSEHTQLIVTTHSDILVDAMTNTPEAVVVCEKQDRQTAMRRLDADDLAVWLEKYRLGELWTSGQLGATRW